MNEQDKIFMKRALQLAKKGLYEVAPNPMVGAVIVHEGKIIGEGYHRKYGKPHAEVNAIESVQDQSLLATSTLYVTLEPCSHHGKTPPCSDLIIEKKIPKVVVATMDPSAKVGGKGIERLRNNGIHVSIGLLKKEATELNKRFLKFHGNARPYISLKWALSSDGFIGRDPNDVHKTDSWITNSLSKQLVHQWRAEEMGILIGKNTALIDNPELSCREFVGKNPIRFVIDPQLTLSRELKIFNEQAKTVVLNTKKNECSADTDFVQFGEDDFFDRLFNYCQQKQIHSILIEGGANTLQRFIDSNNWDEARIFHGTKEFKRGIKGPVFKKEVSKEEMLRDDLIQYFKNSAS